MKSCLAIITTALVGGAISAATGPSVDCQMSIMSNGNITCSDFAGKWNLDVDSFKSINPDVNTCPDLDRGTYCVVGTVTSGKSTTTVAPKHRSSSTSISFISGAPSSVASYPYSPTPTPTTTTPTGVYPTMTGMPSDCSKYHRVVDDDTCDDIVEDNGITLDQLYKWNPSIASGMSAQLVASTRPTPVL